MVTVAVQVAAAAAVIVSAVPALGKLPSPIGPNILDVLSVLFILIMCYGNLRGIREAGKTFALPTYLFSGSVGLMIVVGLIREASGNLHHVLCITPSPTFAFGHSSQSLLSFALIFILLKAYANGGSSLTGIEAVSNAVGALRPPEGRSARQLLVIQGAIVAFLIAGISWLAHLTHAIPYSPASRRCSPRRPTSSSATPGTSCSTCCRRPRADPVHRRQHQLQRVPLPGQFRRRRTRSCPAG